LATCGEQNLYTLRFLVRDAFVRTNGRAIDTMSVPLSVSQSAGTGVHCDHTVHFRPDIILSLDSSLFWAP